MDQTNTFIVSAPSGAGKSTLLGRLVAVVPGLIFSISYTTRGPRGQEVDGKHYFFVDRTEFQRMIGRGDFLEWALVYSKDLYGTPRRFLDDARRLGYDLVLDIDVQGAAQVKERVPDARTVFILPPSRRELEARLRQRGEDSTEVIERRLRRAIREIENFPNYDYVIINDDVDRAAEKLCAIVLAARQERRHAGRAAAPDGAAGCEAGEPASAQEPAPESMARRWIELAESCRVRNAEPLVRPIQQTFLEAKT